MNKREFERRRKEQFKKLLENSTLDERQRIRAGRKARRKLRKEVEELEQND